MSVMSFSPPREGNTVGTIALAAVILGGVATAAALIVPFALYVGAVILIAGLVLAIIGLTRTGSKATSIIALALSVLLGGGAWAISAGSVPHVLSFLQPRPSAEEVSAHMMDFAATTFPMMLTADAETLTGIEATFEARAVEIVAAGSDCMDTVRSDDGQGLKTATREACTWYLNGGKSE